MECRWGRVPHSDRGGSWRRATRLAPPEHSRRAQGGREASADYIGPLAVCFALSLGKTPPCGRHPLRWPLIPAEVPAGTTVSPAGAVRLIKRAASRPNMPAPSAGALQWSLTTYSPPPPPSSSHRPLPDNRQTRLLCLGSIRRLLKLLSFPASLPPGGLACTRPLRSRTPDAAGGTVGRLRPDLCSSLRPDDRPDGAAWIHLALSSRRLQPGSLSGMT
jgi:hypothetical protein